MSRAKKRTSLRPSRRSANQEQAEVLRSGSGVVLSAAALGLAAGFVFWVLQVRLADIQYHFGWSVKNHVVDAACARAGTLWIICCGTGTLAGLAVGLVAARVPAISSLRRVLKTAAIASLGVYVLAVRGVWGWTDDAAGGDGTHPGFARPPDSLPAEATGVPLALAALAIAGIAFCAVRRTMSAREQKDAEDPGSPILLLHVSAGLTAAVFTLQAAYYWGALGDFLRGLAALFSFYTP